MKGRTSKRILSVLLSLVMLLSLLPVSAFATETETAKTATKITAADQLVSGQYVLVADNGYAPTILDGSWVTATSVTANGDTVTVDPSLLWTITVDGATAKLTDSNGKTIAPSGGNNNGIKGADYSWAVAFADGSFTFAGQGDDTVKLAGNTGASNKFRAYKNSTISGKPAGYPCNFTLYKLNAGGSTVEQVATPTGTASSDIKVGDTVAFECATEGAKLQYKIGDGVYQDYTGPVTITTSCTITVKATKDGMKASEEATFTYKAYNVVTQYIRTLATDLENGDQVLIYNPDSSKIMTTEGYTYTNSKGTSKDELVAADATVTGSELTTAATNAAVLTVTKDANGKYTFTTAGDKYLYMDGTNVRLVDTADANTLFQLETTEGGYFIKADTANYNGKAQYLEYYNGYFTVFGMGSNTAIYTFQFFKATLVRDYVDAETPAEKVATPTASLAAGEITKGTEVAFACSTEGAKIFYKTTGDYTEYTAPVKVDADTTFTVKATKDGMTDSDEAIFAYTVKDETPLIADGQYVIYNPGSGKAMSANATGTYYRAGKDVTVENGKIAEPAEDLIWTVKSENGVYTITTADGKKLSMNADRNSLPLDEVNNTWKIEKAKTDGSFYLINANRSTYYVEWFVNSSKGFEEFTTYTYKASNDSLYTLQFIPVDGSDTPDTGNLPKVGDQVVIYNQNAQAVLAAQNDNTDSPAINKAAATIEDGKAVCANGAVVFTVEKNGEYYRFYNKTYGYLCANGTGNNAFYSQTASDDADWTVRTCSGGVGGFELEHRTAKYNGKYSQWLEYYSDSFKVYSMYNVTDYTIYSFYFYPVANSTIDGVVDEPTVDFGTVLPAYVGQDYELTFTVDTPFGVSGNMKAWLSDNTALGITKNEDGTYTVYIPDALVQGDKLTVSVWGTDNKYIPINGTVEIPVKDEPSIIDLTPANGAETGDNKRPTISATIVNAGDDATVTMTVNGVAVNASYKNGKVTYTPAEDMTDNSRVDVELTVTRNDSKSATVNWYFTVGKAQYQLYFGQLHGHTQYSDGSGSLDSALDYVKNLPASANVQFVAFTDHSNYFDSKNNPNPEAALYDTSLVKDSDSSHSWSTYKDTIAKFNASQSDIIAIGGFEMTWSGGPGHINTFNTPGVVSRNNTTLNNKTSDAGMKAYYALLSQSEGVDSISQFNHPGTTFGNFSDFAYWDPVIDSRMYMVEVGNGEGQIGAGGYYPSYEQYIMALDKGWHVAPTNNQDNHKGRWGNANDARDVIITDNFTEEGIYEAIRAMRMYATEDKNLEVGYTVNGLLMGSSITEVPEKLDINVTVNDPDKSDSISKVEIVVNSGKVVKTWDTAAELASGNLSVELDPEYSYYFVRVTEGDGDLAVTAPVWVGETLKLGISNVACGTSTPVTDEELTLTTTLFNSESKDATIKSLTYSIKGGAVIGTDTTEHTLSASSTLDVDFKYTPDKARVMTITVTAVVEQDGKEFTFTKDITLDVLDNNSLVYIGIDASHYNEYVAGNYKDSMGNFGELAAEYSVRTVMLKTSEELIAACNNDKYKALILTAPSRRLEAAQADPKTYSADELKAIAAFNEAGGTVILAGWSDNYENYDVIQNNPAIKHMAATQNEVLAALGSSLRIGDDATYDDVRSAADGVDKWRLYFSDYNMENFLVDGVEVDPDHPYDKLYTERFSHYGGASVYAVDANGNATSTLPSTVSPVVYGHATTYSVDVDKDGLGGAGTPKYTYAENDKRLMVMATEQLAGKGLIVVSGAAFMSNFEVQATISDNGSEKNYSNYKICENLLGKLNPMKITAIKDVQAEKDEGVKFTIEAIVTSNASGYDKNTAFFDCIYVQDGTAGINCFPVAGDFKIGDKVRITGTTSSYQGERQLAVTSIEKIGEATPVEPTLVTAAQVTDGSVLGSLIKVKGVITKVEMADGLVQTIMVKDEAGNECRVFIDGYITTSEDVKDAIVGYNIEAIGLASWDNTFTLSDGTPIAPRIRIRDRVDITCTKSGTGDDHNHNWGEWVITQEPTCTKAGSKTRTCKDCNSTETVSIPATGHNYVNDKCTNCGKAKPSHTQPSVTPSTSVKSGKTADNSNMGLWVVLLSLSLFGSVTLLRSKKRRA